MQFTPTDRIQALPPYIFVELAAKKRALRAAGHDVIDFGIGDPDRPTHTFILDAAHQALDDDANHHYPLVHGFPAYRRQVAEFFARRYGVELEPDREILTLIGSKEGVGHLPLAVCDPGRGVLIPDPGYPAYRAGTIFAGGVPHFMPLRPDHGWLPDLDAIPAGVADNASLMFLNYPNNPTAACAPPEFFEKAVAFARRHEILLAHDAAYNEMWFTEEKPPSILQFEGAREVAIEFHSTSKTFNMTGWRIAFAAGHPDVLAALAKIKSNLDSGQFAVVQAAALAAYAGFERPELVEARAMYAERARVLTEGLGALGFGVEEPKATFYVWAKIPRGDDAMETVNRMLDQAHVVGVPGSGFGDCARDHIRFATTLDVDRTRAALDRLKKVDW